MDTSIWRSWFSMECINKKWGGINVIVTVCIGSSCHLKGSREIIQRLEQLLRDKGLEDKVELRGSFCMGECVNGVCVKINEKLYSLTPAMTDEFFETQIVEALNK